MDRYRIGDSIECRDLWELKKVAKDLFDAGYKFSRENMTLRVKEISPDNRKYEGQHYGR